MGTAPAQQPLEMGHTSPEGPGYQHELSCYAPIAPADPDASWSRTGASQPAKPAPKRKRVACIECRQAKLKCEGLAENSCSCSRCRELSLQCVVNTEYRRVNKRLKINELAEEVKLLRSVVNQNGAAVIPALDATSGSPSPSLHATPPDQPGQSPRFRRQSSSLDVSRSIDSPVNRNQSPEKTFRRPSTAARSDRSTSWMPLQLPPARKPQSLEHVTLNPRQISHLFRLYFDCYHPFFELLDPSLPPDVVHSRSPILFWAITVVAARRQEEDATLLEVLTPCVKTLLWGSIAAPPHSLYTIQALLLLCMWSFPTSSMLTDISFLLVSIAKSAASHIGLHRPDSVQDFSRVKRKLGPTELREAVRVWTGCYVAAESITASIGQQSIFQSDSTIDRACEPANIYALPSDLWKFLLLQRFCNRVNRGMAGKERRSRGRSIDSESGILMAILEAEYEDLERALGDNLSTLNEILLLGTSLQLRAYYFFESPASESRKRGILQAYATSLKLISDTELANKTLRFNDFAPNHFHQMLIMAAIIIMKTVSSSYSRYVDAENGKRAFNVVLALLRRSSVEDNDLKGRASKILAQLWSVHQSLPAKRNEEPSLKVKTRLGASVLHDSLWMWRERFAGQGNNTPPISTPPNLTLDTMSPPVPRINKPSAAMSPGSRPFQANQDQAVDPSFETSPLQSTFLPEPLQRGLIPGETDIMSEFDWMWDVGFPSLIPVDVDYDALSASTTTGGLANPETSFVSFADDRSRG